MAPAGYVQAVATQPLPDEAGAATQDVAGVRGSTKLLVGTVVQVVVVQVLPSNGEVVPVQVLGSTAVGPEMLLVDQVCVFQLLPAEAVTVPEQLV